MAEDTRTWRTSPRAGEPGSPANSGEALRQAEVQLAIGDEDRDEQAREALDAIEAGATGAEPQGSDAVTRRLVDADAHAHEEVESEDDEDLDEALEGKVRENRAESAKEKAQTVYNLTPHGL